MQLLTEKVITIKVNVLSNKVFSFFKYVGSVLKSHLSKRFPDCLFSVQCLFPPISAKETSCQFQNCLTRIRLEFNDQTNLTSWLWTGQPCHENKTSKRSYSCSGCSRIFKLKSQLGDHQNKSANGIRFTCGQCNKVFMSQRNLNNHIQLVHSLNSEELK